MKKYFLSVSVIAMLLLMLIPANLSFAAVDATHPGFRVDGRFLYDNTGEKVILYGINKMVIWLDKDGSPSFSEIAKTGANSVRIVWTTDGTAEELDTAIRNCRAEHMIPMVELHDATGEWSKLPLLVNYWVRPDVVSVIKKHQEYLLINIGNEVGQTVAAATFKSDYEAAVNKMRTAGIHVPLIIDACQYGQDIDTLQSCGPYLTSADPDKNLMFSVHMWWPYLYRPDQNQRVIDELAESANMNLPLLVGEFGHKWDETEAGKIPYKTIMEYCYKNQIGYMPWEWGPGNSPQTFLDMTTDSTFATLSGWGLEVAVTDKYSIQNIAVRPVSMLSNLPPVLPQEPLPYGNLAFNKPVIASSTDTQYLGSNIVDGDPSTRWASNISDPNWVYVDLGAKKDINRVLIYWENAYATQYKIQVSDDATSWTDVYSTYAGTGKTEDIKVTGSGRYVRIYGMQRYNSSWPYSIFELGIYGPESELSTSISPTVAVFDKNPAKQVSIPIILSAKSNTLTSIKNGTSLLVSGTDYLIDNNMIIIKKDYLYKQPIGTSKLTFDYNSGVDPVFAVTIGDTSPSAYIKPGTVDFDKSLTGQADVAITLTSNNNTLIGIKNDTVSLVLGTDYSVSGNTITIKKGYLSKQPIGTTKLTFDLDKGFDPVLKVNVIEILNSEITPTSTVFKTKSPVDVSITMNLNGNTLLAIKNGTTNLVAGTDYSITENIVTIKKEYLAAQPLGTVKLTFDFSVGIDPVLTVTTVLNGIYGDVNNDNSVNIRDYVLLKKYILGSYTLTADALILLDLNRDKVVNALDSNILKQYLLNKITSLPVAN